MNQSGVSQCGAIRTGDVTDGDLQKIGVGAPGDDCASDWTADNVTQ